MVTTACLRWSLGASLLLLTACQSDSDLCKDVQEKLEKCGALGPPTCPENISDNLREEYECIMDHECNEIGSACGA